MTSTVTARVRPWLNFCFTWVASALPPTWATSTRQANGSRFSIMLAWAR